MRKPIIATVATAVALAGCNARGPEVAPVETVPAQPTEAVNVMQVPMPPDELPESIKKAAHDVAVAIKVGAVVNQGSGVRVENDLVLTAGHVFLPQGGSSTFDRKCMSLAAMGTDKSGAEAMGPHERGAGTNTTEKDLGGFTLSDIANSLPPSKGIKISSVPPQAGEVVYFANFQPSEEGPRAPGAKGGLGEPAIYAGVVMPDGSTTMPNQFTALTGIASYGVVPDLNSRKGASGGAVLKIDDGEVTLAGLTVRGSAYEMSAEDVQDMTGILPTNVPAGNEEILGFSDVQMVTPEDLAELRQDIGADKPCSFE